MGVHTNTEIPLPAAVSDDDGVVGLSVSPSSRTIGVTRDDVSFVCQGMSRGLRVASLTADEQTAVGATGLSRRGIRASVAEELRILIVGGIPFGVLVAGLGSRTAMFLLRITSPQTVVGVQSDDDFEIGRFTVSGTYNLLALGAAVGFVGAGVYRLVGPRLIGPMWFRCVTTGLAAGAVVGSMLVHAGGIDFRLLKPTWFAITLFVALPALFAAFIGPVVDRAADESSWTRDGRWRWMLPLVLLVMFPPTMLLLLFATAIVTALVMLKRIDLVQRVRSTMPYGLAVRAVWLSIAMLGALELMNDITEISRVV